MYQKKSILKSTNMNEKEMIENLVEICFNLLVEKKKLKEWYFNFKVKRYQKPKDIFEKVSNGLLDKVIEELNIEAKHLK